MNEYLNNLLRQQGLLANADMSALQNQQTLMSMYSSQKAVMPLPINSSNKNSIYDDKILLLLEE